MDSQNNIYVSAFEVLVAHYDSALIELRRELARVAVEHGRESAQVALVQARIAEAKTKRDEAEAEQMRVSAEMAPKAAPKRRVKPQQEALPLDVANHAPAVLPSAPRRGKPKGAHLLPVRHATRDFFIADILDALPKGDLGSMEHPLFALKTGDLRIRTYERNGNRVTIKPGPDGCATIHDKDVWIYCVSQLVEAMNRGREDVGPVVRFTAHDFLVSTNRSTDGDSYRRMAEAMARLKGTSIETDIETGGERDLEGFGLIDAYRIKRDGGGRMIFLEVELPSWLWRAVEARQVLTLSRDYFRIRKPIDRRIYEIARKHCGTQPKWVVSVKTLHEKSGSTDALRNFRGAVRALAESNELPDYRMAFDDATDKVTFYARGEKGGKAAVSDALSKLTKPKRKAR